jgi:hypothetical protein
VAGKKRQMMILTSCLLTGEKFHAVIIFLSHNFCLIVHNYFCRKFGWCNVQNHNQKRPEISTTCKLTAADLRRLSAITMAQTITNRAIIFLGVCKNELC